MRIFIFLLLLRTAYAVEVTQLYFPSMPGSTNLEVGGGAGTVNTLDCVRWIATADRTGATRLTMEVTSSLGANGGFALYVDDNAGAKLVGTTLNAPIFTPPIAFTATASSFNIVAGTRYRLCVCADAIMSFDAVSTDSSASSTAMKINAFLNAGAAGVVAGTAANSCTGAAVLPSTTGALTAADFAPPMGIIQ
jgi:hypothetical protein